MDPKKNFNEEDKAKVTQFLNHIGKHATFEHKTSEAIDFFKLLSYMQQVLLPKIDANCLEIKRMIESKQAAAENKGE